MPITGMFHRMPNDGDMIAMQYIFVLSIIDENANYFLKVEPQSNLSYALSV